MTTIWTEKDIGKKYSDVGDDELVYKKTKWGKNGRGFYICRVSGVIFQKKEYRDYHEVEERKKKEEKVEEKVEEKKETVEEKKEFKKRTLNNGIEEVRNKEEVVMAEEKKEKKTETPAPGIRDAATEEEQKKEDKKEGKKGKSFLGEFEDWFNES